MDPLVVTFAVGGLGLVAASGVIAGFLREAPAPVEPPADPLEDRRTALERSLDDLEEAHASGALEGAAFERLRDETRERLARVTRVLERRGEAPGRAATAAATADGAAAPPPPARTEQRRVPAWAVALLLGGAVVAVAISSLARDAQPQQTAKAVAPEASDDPLVFFEQRVEDHPDDLAARLDLAHRYLDAGMIERSLEQYAVALDLDPDDAEAHAHVGMILYLSDRPEDALASVDRALETDPRYPEALFFRGVILLRGLDRPQEAVSAFEAYLDAAPFGVERENAKDLIAEAEQALAAG